MHAQPMLLENSFKILQFDWYSITPLLCTAKWCIWLQYQTPTGYDSELTTKQDCSYLSEALSAPSAFIFFWVVWMRITDENFLKNSDFFEIFKHHPPHAMLN